MKEGYYDKKGVPVLTPKQKKFFREPKGMYAIWKELFQGDAFAANNFQNWALTNNLLKLRDGKFEKV